MPEPFSKHFIKTDESFLPSAAERYDLLLQVSEKEVSYSILERERNRFVATGTLRLPIESIFEEVPWLKGNFNSTRIIAENNRSTLIPSVFFDPAEKERYLSFTVEHEPTDLVSFDHIASLDLYSVYSVPSSLLAKLGRLFPGGRISHISSALIRSIHGNYKNLVQDNKVFINVRDHNFDLLVLDGKQLSYFNAFPFQVPEDLAYYVIFVYEQLGLNPEETGVVLSGRAEKNSPVAELLYKYIRSVEMAARSETFTYSYVFRDIPAHAYYTLLNPGS